MAEAAAEARRADEQVPKVKNSLGVEIKAALRQRTHRW